MLHCCLHDNGVIAVIDAQASLPSSKWRCLPHNNGVVALDLWWCCCPSCDCAVAILKLASSPSSQWRCRHHQCHCPRRLSASWHCHRQCAGIFAVIAMSILALITMAPSLLLMRRRVSAVVELALLPLPLVVKLVSSPMLRWHCCHRCAGFLPLLQLQFLP